ncbi:cysteine protease StiP domain-containing protein, partial [Streptomyces albidoflavus]
MPLTASKRGVPHLIPSACLNSTVSGLISRTVLRDD